MAYKALKPCSFAGLDFKIDDTVPVELIQPGAAPALIKMGLIVDMNEQAAPAIKEPEISTVEIVVHAQEGDMPLDITKEGLQAIFDVLTTKAEDAEKIVKNITDGDALILLHICDTRKTIKAAAEERAKAINTEAEVQEEEVLEEGEQ